MKHQKPVRVLVAEDDFLISEEIGRNLKKLGFDRVDVACNGQEAMEMTCSLRPDVVLMDIKMPIMDGLEATRRIQSACPTPVVILTAHESQALVEEAGKAGASAYLAKPPRADEIGRAITMAMARHEDLMTLRRQDRELNKQKEALQASESRLQSIFNSLEESVFVTTPDRKIVNMNDAGQRTFEYAPEAILNRSSEILHVDRAHFVEFGKRIKDAFDKGKAANIEFEARRQSGEVFPTEHTVTLLKDPKEAVIGIISVVRDITERKKAEEAVLRTQKLESVSILAGGIAHDYNNLLSIILGNISLLMDGAGKEPGILQFLNEAEKAGIKARDLTHQLMTLSKGGGPMRKLCAITETVERGVQAASTDADIRLDMQVPGDLRWVNHDPDQLRTVIRNVVANGIESMPGGGVIAVTAENVDIGKAEQDAGLPLAIGPFVRISIKDQGTGIPKEHLPKIFDPYFSTKEMGSQKGMGLGLATAHAVVRKHDGHIAVVSEEEVGTTVHIYLPVPDQKDERTLFSEIQPLNDRQTSSTQRVLVMDDEEMLRTLVKQMLTRLGYEVETVQDGVEAIRLYQTNKESGRPFDAVILDLTIKGGMGGRDTMEKLLEIDPNVRAVVSSGYSNDPVMEKFKDYGFCGTLPKPYQMKDMAESLMNILG